MKLFKSFFLSLLITNIGFAQELNIENELSPIAKWEISEKLNEISGIAYFNGKLYAINDSGNPHSLFELDTISGKILKETLLENAQNIDWESIDVVNNTLTIADIGNNFNTRDVFDLYTLNLSTEYTSVQKSELTLEGHIMSLGRTHDYDFEALFNNGAHQYLLSKNRASKNVKLYQIDLAGTKRRGNITQEFNYPHLITGAHFHKNKLFFIAYSRKGNTYLSQVNFKDGLFDFENMISKKISGPGYQIESICIDERDQFYIASEKTKLRKASILVFEWE